MARDRARTAAAASVSTQAVADASARPPRRARSTRRVFVRRTISQRQRVVFGAVAVVAVVALWQLLANANVIDPILASSPSGILAAAVKLTRSGVLLPAIAQSTKLFVAGFAISLISGLAVGVLIGWSPRLEAALDPFIAVLYAAPRIALVPLIMVWVGLGFKSQIVIVWTTAVFPIVINTAVSVGTIDRNLLAVARSFRATSLDVLWTIALPGAIPGIVAGVRQSVALTLIGVVIAEYFVGNDGVGGLIVNAGQMVNTADAFVGVAIFALAAIVLDAALKATERRLSRWRQ